MDWIGMGAKRLLLALVLGLVSGVALTACDKPAVSRFNAIDITGANYAKQWRMPDTNGQERSLQDFQGKVVYIFFGFAQCPDVCPTTMLEMSQVKEILGIDGENLQIIFVTVDPERDTPEILREYVGAFDPKAVGLVGNADQLSSMAKEFKVAYQKVPGPSEETYTMGHSAGGYIYDPLGNLRLYAKYGTPASELASDIRKLISGN